MFKDNLISLRKANGLSQDELAEKIGVTRQTLSKYETGESLPDIERCKQLADIFGVSMDDLVNYEKTDRENMGLEVPPKGKHVFGMVKVGDKGQIVIPANARKIFDIQPGDNLCPKCGSKTRTMIREHTVLEDFPLFCPKCKYTCVIRFKDGKMEETVPEKA